MCWNAAGDKVGASASDGSVSVIQCFQRAVGLVGVCISIVNKCGLVFFSK